MVETGAARAHLLLLVPLTARQPTTAPALSPSYPVVCRLMPVWTEQCLNDEFMVALLRSQQLFEMQQPAPLSVLEMESLQPRSSVVPSNILLS